MIWMPCLYINLLTTNGLILILYQNCDFFIFFDSKKCAFFEGKWQKKKPFLIKKMPFASQQAIACAVFR